MFRLIFRGMVLFRIREGRLTVLMVQDRGHGGHHRHVPRISFSCRGDGVPMLNRRYDIALDDTVRIDVPGKGGVTKHESFDQYVPSLPRLHRDGEMGEENDQFISARMTVPAGIARVGSLVRWTRAYPPQGPDGHVLGVEAPVEVSFMNSAIRGGMADQIVVEAKASSVGVQSASGLPGRLTPLDPGDPGGDELSPDLIEVLVTNYPRPRSHPTPWNFHYQWMFSALSFTNPREFDAAQFAELRGHAERYYGGALWREDYDGTTRGYPFPYLQPAADGDAPIVVPPGLGPLKSASDMPLCGGGQDGPH